MTELDQHLDNILKASGSGLKNYSMQKTLDDMRNALKAALAVERAACAKLADEYAAEYKEGGRLYPMLNGSIAKAAASACDHIVYIIRARGEA